MQESVDAVGTVVKGRDIFAVASGIDKHIKLLSGRRAYLCENLTHRGLIAHVADPVCEPRSGELGLELFLGALKGADVHIQKGQKGGTSTKQVARNGRGHATTGACNNYSFTLKGEEVLQLGDW